MDARGKRGHGDQRRPRYLMNRSALSVDGGGAVDILPRLKTEDSSYTHPVKEASR